MNPRREDLRGEESSDNSQVAEVSNNVLLERIGGLHKLLEKADGERFDHAEEDRKAHAEFRLAISALATAAAKSRAEFEPVRMIAFGMVGTMLLGLVGTIGAVVLYVLKNWKGP